MAYSPTTADDAVSINGGIVTIPSRFTRTASALQVPALFLRDSHKDAFHSISQHRSSFLHNKSAESIHIKNLEVSSDGMMIKVHWGDGVNTVWSCEDLCSLFDRTGTPQRGLKSISMSNSAVSWSSSSFSFLTFRFQDLLQSDIALFKWLEALATTGLCLVRECPLQPDVALNAFAARTGGYMRATQYDEDGKSIFNVQNKRGKANNQAYTDHGLPLHTDLPFMQYPPDVQLLLCLKPSVRGGGISTFADGMHVAKTLRERRPDLYNALTTHPVVYSDDEKSWCYRHAQPVITVRGGGNENVFIRFNEGVRARDWHRTGDNELLSASAASQVLEGLRTFGNLAESAECQVKHLMVAGDMVCFDNQRVLHGRTEFAYSSTNSTANSAQVFDARHLQGAYLNHADLDAKLLALQTKLYERSKL